MTGTRDEPQHTEQRTDHKLRKGVHNLLGDVRGLHNRMHLMDDNEVEAAHRRFLKYADMIWDRLLEGEEPEA